MKIEDLFALEEIRNLRLGYATHLDSLDADALAELFTEDAVCEFGSYGTWSGRRSIRDSYKSIISPMKRKCDVIHIVTNPWVQLTALNEARGRWYLIEMVTTQQPQAGFTSPGGHANPLCYLGLYEDLYRKIDGRWLIAHVKLNFLWPQRPAESAADTEFPWLGHHRPAELPPS